MYIYIICRTNYRTSGQCLFVRPVKKHESVSRSRYSRILETFARETETVSAETAFQPSRGIRFLARVLRRGGRSWSVFFPFSLWRERGGGRRPMVQRTRVASRRRSRDARHPRSFPRLCVPPFPRHLRIWKRDRRSNHAVQAQEVLDFSRGE